MIVHDCAQGTTAWAALRCGIPTASRFDRIMTPGKKPSASAAAYMNELIAERIMQHPEESFISEWMARGNEFESKAVDFYHFTKDYQTETVGFITNDAGTVGASPDRIIVGQNGLVEIKCPSPAVHVGYLLGNAGASVDKEYRIQVQGQLWLAERDFTDIISYHPEMPEALFRVERDEEFIKELSAHVLSFSRQLEEKSDLLLERGIIKPKAEESQGAEFLSDADIEWALNRFATV